MHASVVVERVLAEENKTWTRREGPEQRPVGNCFPNAGGTAPPTTPVRVEPPLPPKLLSNLVQEPIATVCIVLAALTCVCVGNSFHFRLKKTLPAGRVTKAHCAHAFRDSPECEPGFRNFH